MQLKNLVVADITKSPANRGLTGGCSKIKLYDYLFNLGIIDAIVHGLALIKILFNLVFGLD
ncbi:hypothetical protein CP10139811_0489 [Chlamydia ibidis]|uniref:Uncharacterized protein n=2 Tax=Chlamydia ibidis TaxID=1405396 RepID=S7KEY2_9CHLA|nr:hypothetical protein CP10139811_0489 [Chlamydia ibidis]EQM62426.1 hypothetical protein H359_0868 [Chlamydia ibidis 10-1398/6]